MRELDWYEVYHSNGSRCGGALRADCPREWADIIDCLTRRTLVASRSWTFLPDLLANERTLAVANITIPDENDREGTTADALDSAQSPLHHAESFVKKRCRGDRWSAQLQIFLDRLCTILAPEIVQSGSRRSLVLDFGQRRVMTNTGSSLPWGK